MPRSTRRIGAILGFTFLSAWASLPASAAPTTTRISAASPFADCTVGAIDDESVNFVNAEVEPWIAVNPVDPDNIIVAYQQDRWSDGSAHGLVTGVSHDGGATWSRSFAHFSRCSGGNRANGGDLPRSTDPWVTFGPNGVAYLISLATDTTVAVPTSAVLVATSRNGGDTWSEPTTLIRDTDVFKFNDKESITADPTDARFVYAIWDRSRKPGETVGGGGFSAAFRGDPIFTRTTDGGQTWSAPRDLFDRNRNEFTVGHQIVVLPDGTLVDVFFNLKGSGAQGSPNPFTFDVIRSTDHGRTWSRPITVALDRSVPDRDPDTGGPIRAAQGLPEIAVDPNDGTIYVVWEDGRFSGGAHNDVALSRSTDGGFTWSRPIKVNQTPVDAPALVPSVEVAADGTVGVTYYDLRNNTPNPATLPTDYFLVSSDDHGRTWGNEVRITGRSFDFATAPVSEGRGFFLGDYMGLETIGNAFVPVFVRTTGSTTNRTDVFFTKVAA